MKIKNPTTHLIWASGCLGILLLISVSLDISRDEDLPTIISVAVGISSLLVSLVAIAITLLSGGSITHAYNNISDVSKTTSDLISQLKKYSGDIMEIKNDVKSISTKISLNSIVTNQNIENSTVDRDDFINSTSTMTKVAYILCIISFMERKPFKIKEVINSADRFMEGYFLASFGTFHLFDFIDMNIEGYNITISDVKDVNKEYLDNIIDSIEGEHPKGCIDEIIKHFQD